MSKKVFIKREVENNILIYTVKGDLVINNNEELVELIENDLRNGKKIFLFDFENLFFMDSSSLGILSKILKSGCTLKVILNKENENIKEMIELIIMHFDKTGYFTSKEKALESLKNSQ